MENPELTSQNSKLIERADLTITSPAYSMDEKLMAIEFLEHIPTEQAIKILRRTAEMFSWSVSEEKGIHEIDEDLPDIPISGMYQAAREERHKKEGDSHTILETGALKMIQMAERAAKALANNPHQKGLLFLEESLKDLRTSAEVRFVSALGLGGNTSRVAFLTLAQGLRDPHSEVRDRAILSLKESLNALHGAGLHRAEVVTALQAATELAYALNNPADLFVDKSCMFSRFLLKKLNVVEVELAHIAIIPKLQTTDQIEILFEFLGNQKLSLESVHNLAKIVVLPGLPGATYRAIAKILRNKKDQEIIQMVTKVKAEKASLSHRLLNFLLRKKIDPMEAAADDILNDKNDKSS